MLINGANFRHLADKRNMDPGYGVRLDLTEEQKKKILDQMYGGMSIRKICLELDCSHSTFFRYLERDPIFAKKVDLARRESAHVLADDLLNEYDNAETMTQVKKADGKSKNLQWLAAKRHPETYGERLDVNHNVHVDMTGLLDEAQNRLDKYLTARDVTPKNLYESDTDSNKQVKSIVSKNSDSNSDSNE